MYIFILFLSYEITTNNKNVEEVKTIIKIFSTMTDAVKYKKELQEDTDYDKENFWYSIEKYYVYN